MNMQCIRWYEYCENKETVHFEENRETKNEEIQTRINSVKG